MQHALSDETRALAATSIVNLRVFARRYCAVHPEAVSPSLAAQAGLMLVAYSAVFESLAPLLGISQRELDDILESKRKAWLAEHGTSEDEG